MPPQQELRFATERAREWVERGIFGPDRIEEGVEMFRALMIAEWSRCGTKANSCERFLLLDYSGEDDLGGDPAVRVLEHRVWNEKVRMRVQTSSRCFARLSYAFYPFLEVTVDGREVAPLQTADRFIVVPLEAGTHDIELAARLSPLRQALLGLDIALLIGLGLLAAFERGRVRRWWRQLPLPRPSTLLTGRQSG
jgi:hypothetical protein